MMVRLLVALLAGLIGFASPVWAGDYELVKFIDFHDTAGNKIMLLRTGLFGDVLGYGVDDGRESGNRFRIYKTEDRGATWSLINTVTVNTVTSDQDYWDYRVLSNGDIIWLHTSPAQGYNRGWLYLSRDGGTTWTEISPTPGFSTDGYSPVFKCTEAADRLWLVTDPVGNTLNVSDDLGANWTDRSFGVEGIRLAGEYGFAAFTGQRRDGYNLEPRTHFLYDRNRDDWTNIDDRLPDGFYLHRAYGYPRSNGLTAISFVDRETDFSPRFFLLGSTDQGTTFKTFYTGTAEDDFVMQRGFCQTDQIAYLSGLVTEDGETKFEIRKTTDGGATWSVLVHRRLDGAFGIFLSDSQGRLRCEISLDLAVYSIGYYDLGTVDHPDPAPTGSVLTGLDSMKPSAAISSKPAARQ